MLLGVQPAVLLLLETWWIRAAVKPKQMNWMMVKHSAELGHNSPWVHHLNNQYQDIDYNSSK